MTEKIIRLSGVETEDGLYGCEVALNGIKGVSATVDFDSATSRIIYDEESVSLNEIYSALSSFGFKIDSDGIEGASRKKSGKQQRPSEKKEAVRKAAVSAAVSIAITALLVLIPILKAFNISVPVVTTMPWFEAVIGTILFLPIAYAGRSIYPAGLKALCSFRPNTKTLAALGTALAAGFSFFSSVMVFAGHSEYISTVYFPACGVIVSSALLGSYLEERSGMRAGEPIKKLKELFPKSTIVIIDDVEVTADIENLRVGDLVLVHPGKRIPCDGVIEAGKTSVDESMFTGEVMPVDKGLGDMVYAGTFNYSGFISIRAERVGDETSLSRMIKAVENLAGARPKTSSPTQKAETAFSWGVLAAGILLFAIWMTAAKDVLVSLQILIGMLTVCSPFSLCLATSMSDMFVAAKGAKEGVLFKDSHAIRTLCSVNTVAMDKTGTVTVGKPYVTDVLPMGASAEEIIMLSASLMVNSAHPMANAVLDYASKNDIYTSKCEDFRSSPGCGMTGRVEDSLITIDNSKRVFSGAYEGYLSLVSGFEDDGKDVMAVSKDGVPIGMIAFADKLKPTSKAAISKLSAMGIKTVMLTGDSERFAKMVAEELCFDRYYAGISPDKKAEIINVIKKSGRRVAMVGDSTNDAIAFSAADIGAAIGTGSPVVIECAGIVLVRNDLRDLSKGIRLSHAARSVVRGNIFWSLVYNCLMLPIATGLVYILGGPLPDPMLAAVCMLLSTVSVFFNSKRLKYMDLTREYRIREKRRKK